MGNDYWKGHNHGKRLNDGSPEDWGAKSRQDTDARLKKEQEESDKRFNDMIFGKKEPDYSSSGGCASVIAILIVLYILI